MLISLIPTSILAVPAADIPAEIPDNAFLDARNTPVIRCKRKRISEKPAGDIGAGK